MENPERLTALLTPENLLIAVAVLFVFVLLFLLYVIFFKGMIRWIIEDAKENDPEFDEQEYLKKVEESLADNGYLGSM